MYKEINLLITGSLKENYDRDALWIKGKKYSYGFLSGMAGNIIPLIEKETKPVAILTYNCPETYAAILASLVCGTGFVPISPSFPTERVNKILQLSECSTLLTIDINDRNKYKQINKTIICSKLPETKQTIKNNKIPDNKIACILFTSGSTGEPKGVPVTFKNISCTLDAYFALGYGPDANDRCLQMFEFTFDMSLISYLPALLSGACVYSISDDKYRFMNAFKIINDHKLTFAVFVPSTVALVHKYLSSFLFPELKCCLFGGEPLHTTLLKEWVKCTPNSRQINISGPTETTMACMGYEIDCKHFSGIKNHNGIIAFGKPWKNTRAIVVDKDCNILPEGTKGELCFSGDNVMNGYIKNTGLNNEKLFEKTIENKKYIFYRTGDAAYVDKEGDYYTCGRIDLQVKIQGYRIEPTEIEAVCREITGNTITAAIPYEKHEGLNAIKFFIEGEDDMLIDKIGACFKSKLPLYMIPDEIILLKKIPLNSNGKIDRNKLKESIENKH